MPITRAYTKAGSPLQGLANPVINGGFDIWQRGTSISAPNANTYTADRWTAGRGGNALTVSRQSVGDSTNLPNIQYCARVQRDSGNSNTTQASLVQSIETANAIPFAGRTITLSFYARRGSNYSASGDLLQICVDQGTGTDQSIWAPYTGLNRVLDQTVALTTTWQRYAYTFTLASTTTEFGPFFQYIPTGTAGANDFFEVTGVQIDLGTYTASTAPAFRRSGGTLAGELAACQRYYFRQNSSSAYGFFGWGNGYSTGLLAAAINLPVQMRITPTAIDTSAMSTFAWETGSTSGNTPTTITINSGVTNQNILSVDVQKTTTFTVGSQYKFIANNSTSAYIGASAEL